MAVDEAILEASVRAGDPPPPTLRLYGWDPPALSLGRSQCVAESCDPGFLREAGIDLVRRPSGGLAVLHERERSYAVVGPLRSPWFPGGVIDTYGRIARALVIALGSLGLNVAAGGGRGAERGGRGERLGCFERASAHEILLGGRKVVGSAQLRRRGAFLQHGSIQLDGDPARLARALGRVVRRVSALGSPGAPAPIDPDRLDVALAIGFERAFGCRVVRRELTPEETRRAAELCASGRLG
jgi:lipoate-protein ligase A